MPRDLPGNPWPQVQAEICVAACTGEGEEKADRRKNRSRVGRHTTLYVWLSAHWLAIPRYQNATHPHRVDVSPGTMPQPTNESTCEDQETRTSRYLGHWPVQRKFLMRLPCDENHDQPMHRKHT
jgi:hypothetical protein